MRNRIDRATILGMVVLTFVCQQNVFAQQWPAFRANNDRSGLAGRELDCPRLELQWNWQASLPPEPAWDGPARWDAFARIRDLPAMRQYDACFHPVSDGEKIYFGSSSEDTLFALDSKTGTETWRFVANGPIRLAPTCHKKRIYFGCDDGFAYCLDSANGKLVWKFSPSKHLAAAAKKLINNDRLISRFPIRTGVTIRDGRAYFAASFLPWQESFLASVNADSGKPDMAGTFVTRHSDVTLEGALLATQDRLLVPQGRVAPMMFDLKDGSRLGPLPGGGGVTIVLTDQGEVVRTEGGGAARRGQVGVFREKKRVASFPRGRSIVVDKDRYFVVDGQKLFAASRQSNELKWQREVDDPLELIKTGKYIVVGGRDHVTAMDGKNGEVVWSAQVVGRAFGLAVAGNQLFVSTDSGRVYAFSPVSQTRWRERQKPIRKQLTPVMPSPEIRRVRERSLLHRWVFHRSGMSDSQGRPLETMQVQQGMVKDQSGGLAATLQGKGKLIRLTGDSPLEAMELEKSFFPLPIKAAKKLPRRNLTAEAWVRVDQPAEWGGLVGHIQDDGSTEHGWLLGYRGGKFSFAVAGSKSGLTYLTAPKPFVNRGWYHVVGSYDSKEMRLYVNGSLVAFSEAEKGDISYSENCHFSLGAYKDANESFPLVGAIHEIRIYEKVLSATEVAQAYRGKAKQFPQVPSTAEESKSDSVLAWGPLLRFVRPGEVEIRYGTHLPVATMVDLIPEGSVRQFRQTKPTKSHRILLTDLPHRRQLQYQILISEEKDAPRSNSYSLDTHFDWSLKVHSPAKPWVKQLVGQSANTRGIVLLVGESLAEKARNLAEQTGWCVNLLVEDEETAARVRDLWQKEYRQLGGTPYGRKLSVLVGSAAELPAAFATVVISETNTRALRRLVRPSGGMLHNGTKAVWKRGAIQGSGEWSHMYGRADNSAFGGETLSQASNREDLQVQWIGRPGPRYQTDRQNRKPSPLAAGGRMYLQGQQRMIALDSFSGSVLWSIEAPKVMRWNVPHDCSNWCADSTGIFVAAESEAWYLDGKSGEIGRRYSLPENDRVGPEHHWGFIARTNQHLIGTVVRKDAVYRDWWGSSNWYDSTGGADTHVIAGDMLFALDPKTGNTRWKYPGLILHPTITIDRDRIFFVEDRTEKHLKGEGRRISLDPQQEHFLVSLDLNHGKIVWQKRLPEFAGHVSSLYVAAGGSGQLRSLVVAASIAQKQKFTVATYELNDGQSRWNKQIAWESNHHGKHISRPAIQGELVYLRPEVLNLETGETIARGFPAGHGCSSYTLSTGGLFSRLGETTWWDVRNQKTHRFKRVRTDCWISVIPAQGMLLSAEGGGGCSCGSWLETSLGWLPRQVDEQLPDED